MHTRTYLFESTAGKERETELFHLLVPSLDGHNDHGWSGPELGARNFFEVSDLRI